MTLETSKKNMEKTQGYPTLRFSSSPRYDDDSDMFKSKITGIDKANRMERINKLAGHNFKRDFERKYNDTKIEIKDTNGNHYALGLDSVNFTNNYGTHELNFSKESENGFSRDYMKVKSYTGHDSEKLIEFNFDGKWYDANIEANDKFKLTEDSKKTLVNMLELNY